MCRECFWYLHNWNQCIKISTVWNGWNPGMSEISIGLSWDWEAARPTGYDALGSNVSDSCTEQTTLQTECELVVDAQNGNQLWETFSPFGSMEMLTETLKGEKLHNSACSQNILLINMNWLTVTLDGTLISPQEKHADICSYPSCPIPILPSNGTTLT